MAALLEHLKGGLVQQTVNLFCGAEAGRLRASEISAPCEEGVGKGLQL